MYGVMGFLPYHHAVLFLACILWLELTSFGFFEEFCCVFKLAEVKRAVFFFGTIFFSPLFGGVEIKS